MTKFEDLFCRPHICKPKVHGAADIKLGKETLRIS